MASFLPIPEPPRTPTPPTPTEHEAGLGIVEGPQFLHSSINYDPNSLSPMRDTFFGRFGSMDSNLPSPANVLSPIPNGSGSLRSDGNIGPPSARGSENPFNYETQTYTLSPVAKSVRNTAQHEISDLTNHQNIGQRRGHRYKHSSVSTQHQVFQEPLPRPPLALPASLPIPTFREAWKSMSKEQTTRIAWCLCHVLVATYTLYSAQGSLALTALSHLIFFDAISATICVVVDVFCNFEVWKRSSIRHPFGLERAEVLAGFAMSVFLLFMGFDLISHNLKHVLESIGNHAPHHPHTHERVSPGSVDSAALFAIVATLVSAIGLKNHARISKAMRFAYIQSLPSILSNPSHFLTLSCSGLMLFLPLLSIKMYTWLDRLLCSFMAISMFFLGIRLATAQGLMLLMSYSGAGVSDVMAEIESDPSVTAIEEARFWQVHYGLCMANLKLRVRSGDDGALGKLREKIGALVKNRLGGGYGKGGGVKWEVTTQLTLDGNL